MLNWTRVLAITAIGFGIAQGFLPYFQTSHTGKAATAALTQTTLLRQQLVGTMGAVLTCDIRPDDVGVVVLSNTRGVDARDLDGSVQITHVILPDLAPIAATPSYRFSSPVVAHNGHWSEIC